MAYEISFLPEDDVLMIVCRGPADLAENERARQEVLQACQAKGVRKVLSDCRDAQTEGVVTTADLYAFGRSWRDAGAPDDFMLASVLPRTEQSRRDVEFSTTVGKNRDLCSEVFDDIDEALKWLRES